jgi:hypothetical protein
VVKIQITLETKIASADINETPKNKYLTRVQVGDIIILLQRRKEKPMDKVTLEVTEEEATILGMATSMFLKFMEEQVDKHKNHKDYSMDKLFAIMEMYANAGDLWRRVHLAAGTTEEEIREYLSQE